MMEKQNRTKTKCEKDHNVKLSIVKHGLCSACVYREVDARRKFAEHERSELVKVKPGAMLASRVLPKFPV